jgi:hypothetical protein
MPARLTIRLPTQLYQARIDLRRVPRRPRRISETDVSSGDDADAHETAPGSVSAAISSKKTD